MSFTKKLILPKKLPFSTTTVLSTSTRVPFVSSLFTKSVITKFVTLTVILKSPSVMAPIPQLDDLADPTELANCVLIKPAMTTKN